jgi:5-methyltetrahydrofolate--homocysteine methyltransferase
MRSTEQLLCDLVSEPDAVAKFETRLMEIWIEHYEHVYAALKDAAQGSAGWFELWSPGKFYAAQNDFAYMISPADFERCFLPSIKAQTEYLDHTIYHVDGVGNFRHVDLLCALPRLQALQILPGDGKPSPLYYRDVLLKTQKAGKNLHITLPPQEVPLALDMLSRRGLMISTRTNSVEEAQALIRYVEKNSKP